MTTTPKIPVHLRQTAYQWLTQHPKTAPGTFSNASQDNPTNAVFMARLELTLEPVLNSTESKV